MKKGKEGKGSSRKKPKEPKQKQSKPQPDFRKAQEKSSKENELAVTKDELLGSTLTERYRLMEEIGKGGMGTIYLAEDENLKGKKVAVKVLPPEIAGDEETATRFVQEALIAPRIDHENIVDVTDLGVTPDGRPFYVMELLKGKDLGDTLEEEGTLPLERIKRIVLQICRALNAAHEIGVVHRDMKPHNIFLVERSGEKDYVKILDFGLVKLLEKAKGERSTEVDATSIDAQQADAGLTIAGTTLGTPRYMAPEQVRGKEIDNRTDIYAVGIIMYEMLCGRTPFDDDEVINIFKMHLAEPVVAPSKIRPDLDIPEDFEAIVLKALEKDPENRYQNTKEIERDILGLEDKDAAGRPAHLTALDASQKKLSRSSAAYVEIRKHGERKRRIRRWSIVAGALLLAGGGAAVGAKHIYPLVEQIVQGAQEQAGDASDE